MLGYFRINDPYRLVIIFIFLLIFRLPFILSSGWLSIPELEWMIVGEKLNNGALLYTDIWDDIGPLSALVYKSLDFLFGRSGTAIQVFGLLVFFIQVFLMNSMALKHKMYNENNYLPALFYGLLGLLFYNIIILSPQLMGMTFVLIALDGLITHVESRNKTDANLINIGLFTGIAALFYLPLLTTAFIHIFILLFFTNTIIRRYLLMLYGLLLPLSLVWLFYYWQSETAGFYTFYLSGLFFPKSQLYLELKPVLVFTGITAALYLIASLKILSGYGFNIFQVRIQKTMFFASIVCFIIWIRYADRSGTGLILFMPWIAFFLSHFFLTIRHNLKRELGFTVYLASVLVMYLGLRYSLPGLDQVADQVPLVRAEKSGNAPAFKDKTIVVLGPDLEPYFHGRLSTPYFNWSLSESQLTGLDFFDNLEAIDRNFRNDMPEYIIDQVGLAPKLFDKIPKLGDAYEKISESLYKKRQI